MVTSYSDNDDSVHRLGEFTRDMDNVEKIELLPYHELGKYKWIAMGEEYKLGGVKPLTKETTERVKTFSPATVIMICINKKGATGSLFRYSAEVKCAPPA